MADARQCCAVLIRPTYLVLFKGSFSRNTSNLYAEWIVPLTPSVAKLDSTRWSNTYTSLGQ